MGRLSRKVKRVKSHCRPVNPRQSAFENHCRVRDSLFNVKWSSDRSSEFFSSKEGPEFYMSRLTSPSPALNKCLIYYSGVINPDILPSLSKIGVKKIYSSIKISNFTIGKARETGIEIVILVNSGKSQKEIVKEAATKAMDGEVVFFNCSSGAGMSFIYARDTMLEVQRRLREK